MKKKTFRLLLFMIVGASIISSFLAQPFRRANAQSLDLNNNFTVEISLNQNGGLQPLNLIEPGNSSSSCLTEEDSLEKILTEKKNITVYEKTPKKPKKVFRFLTTWVSKTGNYVKKHNKQSVLIFVSSFTLYKTSGCWAPKLKNCFKSLSFRKMTFASVASATKVKKKKKVRTNIVDSCYRPQELKKKRLAEARNVKRLAEASLNASALGSDLKPTLSYTHQYNLSEQIEVSENSDFRKTIYWNKTVTDPFGTKLVTVYESKKSNGAVTVFSVTQEGKFLATIPLPPLPTSREMDGFITDQQTVNTAKASLLLTSTKNSSLGDSPKVSEKMFFKSIEKIMTATTSTEDTQFNGDSLLKVVTLSKKTS